MTWRGKEGKERRVRFVLEWRGVRGEFGRYCAEKRISRKTGYEWIKRYRGAGLEGLKARSPGKGVDAVAGETESATHGLEAHDTVIGQN